MKRVRLLVTFGLSLAAAPALASSGDPAPVAEAPSAAIDHVIARDTGAKEDMGDANRTICRSVEQLGTRLSKKKVCATASEWAAMRTQQREGTERMQTNRWKSN